MLPPPLLRLRTFMSVALTPKKLDVTEVHLRQTTCVLQPSTRSWSAGPSRSSSGVPVGYRGGGSHQGSYYLVVSNASVISAPTREEVATVRAAASRAMIIIVVLGGSFSKGVVWSQMCKCNTTPVAWRRLAVQVTFTRLVRERVLVIIF